MQNLSFNIIGSKSLLFNKFNIEVVSSMTKVQTGSAGNSPDEWRQKIFEKDNQLYIPGSYWFSCICAGGVYTKAGRGTIKSKVAACVTIEDEITLLNRHMPTNWQEMKTEDFTREHTAPVYLDIRGVMNPNSKGRNVRYRVACSPGWECELNIQFDNTVLSKSQVVKCVEDSGKMIGIGDGRTLGFGRFKAELK